jgi:hypothetical protein
MGFSVEVVRKPPKPVPEEVARIWAAEWSKEGKKKKKKKKKVDWERLMPQRGSVHTAERARNGPRSTISPPLEPPKRGAQGWSNDLSDSLSRDCLETLNRLHFAIP